MDLVTGALGKLPSKLLELLKDEYKLQAGVKDQIRRLSRELTSMHEALDQVAMVPPDQLDKPVLLWACDVREASYDLEDIIDTFLVRVHGPPKEPAEETKFGRLMKKVVELLSLSKIMARHEIAGAIDVISKHLEELETLRQRYKVDGIVPKPAATTSIDPRLSALYTKTSQLVGIDEQRDKLIQMLTQGDHSMQPDQEEETKIVSVVGVGGLGKTTLVKAVFEKLTMNIPYKAFVPVGQNSDSKKTLQDILIDLDKQRYTTVINVRTLDEKHLIDELREFLMDKRYFIVIDDVWDIKLWKEIKDAFVDNRLCSKIVITTRKHDVAKEVGCSYTMERLTHESSKILFYGRIFGSKGECPPQFSEVSEIFLKKCGGVPLAIITISSLLANKPRNIKEWNEVCDSIGSGLGSNHNMENMIKILSLSYYDLPSSCLKTCLLCLSIFPEDYEIQKERLIWRWIAEGFIQRGEESQSLFELGESYFNELINRSLIQVADTSIRDGTPLSCRVHDMVLELICSLSRQENFATTVLGDSRQRAPPSGSKKVRRLSLHNTTTWPTIMDTSSLRSLTIFSSAIINLMPSLSCCHLLRVLDLQSCNLRDHPNLRFLGNLLHLRYLSLETPNGMAANFEGSLECKLNNLSYLRLRETTSMPTWICPASLPHLSNLDLEMVQVRVDDIQVLGKLQSLRYLEVDVSGDFEETGNIQVLERFIVSHDAFPCVIKCSFSGFSMVPSAFQPGSMPMLEEFTFDIRLTDFAGGKFTVGDLALGHLPSLQSVCVALNGEQNVSEVEEKLRHEADVHPNNPGISIGRC